MSQRRSLPSHDLATELEKVHLYGNITVRKLRGSAIKDFGQPKDPEVFYLVTLTFETAPVEVSSASWQRFGPPSPGMPSPSKQARGFTGPAPITCWEVHIKPYDRPTGIMAGLVQIVDHLWAVSGGPRWVMAELPSLYGNAQEAIDAVVLQLRNWDAARRLGGFTGFDEGDPAV